VTVQDIDRTAFAAQWQQWHAEHETRLADPHGFLAVTSLRFLDEIPTRFDDAPGTWSSTTEGVKVELAEGEHLTIEGVTIDGTYNFGVIAERASVFAGFGAAVIEVGKRGGHDIVRPRHPENDLRVNFKGVPAFRPDPRWVITGKYVAFEKPIPTTVGAAVDGLQHVYEAPGRIDFEVDGAPQSLTAFNGGPAGALFILFTDATSGITTYAANRSLHLDAADAAGSVTLDFNRATNLPCAYTDLATCPLPPAENHLQIAVEAGEKTPYERTSEELSGRT
jgi:uncharacterized protein (DUF1684 family)